MRGSSRDVTSPARREPSPQVRPGFQPAEFAARDRVSDTTRPRSGMIAPMGTTSTATMPMPAAPPDSVYASLLRTLYGRTDAELGFTSPDNVTPPAHRHDEAMMEIRARLACSSGVDASLIANLDRHTHELRLLDRRLGAATILDQISAHITTVRQLMMHTIHTKDRQALARIIADAAALAGWQALDTGATHPGLAVLRHGTRMRVRSRRPRRAGPRPRRTVVRPLRPRPPRACGRPPRRSKRGTAHPRR